MRFNQNPTAAHAPHFQLIPRVASANPRPGRLFTFESWCVRMLSSAIFFARFPEQASCPMGITTMDVNQA